jgi:hypothetical protein
LVLQHGLDAAEAELDLARIQKIKIAWIDRVLVFGDVEFPGKVGSEMQYIRDLKSISRKFDVSRTGSSSNDATPRARTNGRSRATSPARAD